MARLGSLRPEYDAVVVGARCAGAAAAMLMARSGLRVLAVDCGRYGSDTLSTHALMRGAVLQLHRWNVLPEIVKAGTPAVRRTTFDYGDAQVVVPIKPRDGEPYNVERPYEGNGYQFEAAHAMQCLRDGLTESPVMPLDETLAIMRVMDRVREQIGMRYACD